MKVDYRFSSHPFLSGALPIPHPNKQNIYITVKFCFFIHPFKRFAAIFQKTLLFNIDYAEDPPPKKDISLDHIQ